MKLFISDQAYTSIKAETFSHLNTETGGIFLGHVVDENWYIIEVIDPGYNGIVRQSSFFEYDEVYVSHLANVRARIYEQHLTILGLWHRHPGSFDRFSTTDDETHKLYLHQNPERGIISSLVNLDPSFRMTHYYIDSNINHFKLKNISIGDTHIPDKFLQLKKYSKSPSAKRVVSSNVTEIDELHYEKGKPILSRVFSYFKGSDNSSDDSSELSESELMLDELMDKLDKEFEYLDEYNYEYSFSYHKDAQVLEIVLDKLPEDLGNEFTEPSLNFQFYFKGSELYYKFNEIEALYTDNKIKESLIGD